MSVIIALRCCGSVEAGKPVVICECGRYRQANRPHAYIPTFEASIRFVSSECPNAAPVQSMEQVGSSPVDDTSKVD